MLALIYISIIATLLATILVIALRPLAIRLRLVDKPDGRKTHKGDIPLIGGPVIWLVVMIGVIFLIPNPPWSVVFAATMLVFLGMVDDRQPIPARLKLVFHIAAATIVVIGENLGISDIGIFQEVIGKTDFEGLHAVLAIIAIAAAINAFNFIDGIDGLSAGMALLALTHTNLAFNLLNGAIPPDYAFFAVLLSGALAGFLLFNLHVFNGRKIFLGDSGSMLIGLLVAVALIGASQATGRLQGNPTIPASPMPLADCHTDYRYGEYYCPSLGQRTLTHGPGPHPFAPQNYGGRLFSATHFTGHDFIFCWGILDRLRLDPAIWRNGQHYRLCDFRAELLLRCATHRRAD